MLVIKVQQDKLCSPATYYASVSKVEGKYANLVTVASAQITSVDSSAFCWTPDLVERTMELLAARVYDAGIAMSRGEEKLLKQALEAKAVRHNNTFHAKKNAQGQVHSV